MGKKEIRAAMRALNNALTATERLTASTAIFSAIERLPEFRAARTIAFFSALPDEPATDEVLARWNETRRVVLPRVEGETMHFYSCRPETLRFGAFGILEPQGEEECPPERIDLMICPGVAFTEDGRRLGRGKGYYDRYLARDGFRAWCIGVCFGCQIVDDLPCEPFDRRVDEVVTGRSL